MAAGVEGSQNQRQLVAPLGSPEWRHPVLTSPKLVKIHKSLARPARGRFPAGRREATRQMAGMETFPLDQH